MITLMPWNEKNPTYIYIKGKDRNPFTRIYLFIYLFTRSTRQNKAREHISRKNIIIRTPQMRWKIKDCKLKRRHRTHGMALSSYSLCWVHCIVARHTNKLRQWAHWVARPKRLGKRLIQHNGKGFTNFIVYIF